MSIGHRRADSVAWDGPLSNCPISKSNGDPLDRTPLLRRKEKEEIRGEEARTTGEEPESVLSCLPELLVEVEMKYLLGDLTSHCMSNLLGVVYNI